VGCGGWREGGERMLCSWVFNYHLWCKKTKRNLLKWNLPCPDKNAFINERHRGENSEMMRLKSEEGLKSFPKIQT